MSDAPAIISGDFATYRHVQGRKTLQLVIEIPAEAAANVFATLGHPGSGEPIPVAVARLDPKAIAKPEHPKERRPFTELPYSQQAAMRCQERGFWDFLTASSSQRLWSEMVAKYGTEASAAAAMIRQQINVESRAEINKGMPSGDRWEVLEAEYFAWQRGMR